MGMACTPDGTWFQHADIFGREIVVDRVETGMGIGNSEIYRGEVGNHHVWLRGEDGPALLVHPLSDTSDVVIHVVPIFAVIRIRHPVAVNFLLCMRSVEVSQVGVVPDASAAAYGYTADGFGIAVKHVEVVDGVGQLVETFNLFFGRIELAVVNMSCHVVVSETENDMTVHVAQPFEYLSCRIELACDIAWDNQHVCWKELGHERIQRHFLPVIVVVKIRKNKGLHTTKIGYEGRFVKILKSM